MKKAESGAKWAINFQLEWSLHGISYLPDNKHSKVLRMLYDNRVQTKLSSGRSFTIYTGGRKLLLLFMYFHYMTLLLLWIILQLNSN